MSTTSHIIYGEPARGLVDAHAGAAQVSPLVPGSAHLEDAGEGTLGGAIIAAPPGTLERRYVLALALRSLAIGAPLTAIAPKDKGGNRLAAELEAFGCTVHCESRSHHRIVTTTRHSLHGIGDALREGGMQQHAALGLWTQPGVFSWDRLDAGSALLLKHLPALRGAGADLGCGIGILSQAVLCATGVTALTLADIDRRAIDCARKNIRDARAHFEWVDVRDTLPATGLDFVVMNPPFHDTGVEDKTLGQTFLTRAAAMLKPGGQCWLTANKHLPYEQLLAKHFRKTELVAQADGFKIYAAEK